MANDNDTLRSQKIIDNQTIAAFGTFTSPIININDYKLLGDVTLQVSLTGDGTVKIEFEQSNNFDTNGATGDFVIPSSGGLIVASFTKTSGSASDGKDLFDLSMFNSQFFRIKVTETGGANPVVINNWLSMQ